MDQVQVISQNIKETEVQINDMSNRVKEMFAEISVRFVESKNIRTSEIDQLYKSIDSTFNAKAKLEAHVRSQKNVIIKTLLE
jgi:regulator of replication initiation timing